MFGCVLGCRARETNKHEPSHPYIHEYMLLSGGKGKEVSGSLSPLPAESKVFVYKLVGVCWSGRSEAPLPDQANQTNLLITHKKEPKDHQPRPCHVNPNVGWGREASLPPSPT